MIWEMSVNQASLVIVGSACLFLLAAAYRKVPLGLRVVLLIEACAAVLLILAVQVWDIL